MRSRLCALARRAFTLAALAAGTAGTLQAQYFGRNKVQYERFHFDVLATRHFDIHYYADEATAARDAARMLERWNTRLSGLFNHPLHARKPIVLYADQPDFQQTNVIGDQLDESTGGVTESGLDRMVLPLTGVYAESDHVLGHEMVHVFQYDLVEQAGRGASLEGLDSWLVEGMAEYLSLGGEDPHTAMWLRDAVLRNDVPTIKQLSDGRKYFPYRYGEALWAYIGGTWGDDMVPRLFRASLQSGFDDAVRRVLGMTVDSLSSRWRATIKSHYGPLVRGRTAPGMIGDRIAFGGKAPGDYNVGPAVSPDGRRVAYFSTRNLGGFELLVADALTGKVQASLAAPGVSTHFDALSFLYSAGSWSPDGRRLAFVTYAGGDNEIDIVDVSSRKIATRITPRDVGAISTVAWSPDGRTIAFSGSQGGLSDLYLYDLGTRTTRRLTSDRFADLQPAWSPDGKTIAFATDRGDSAGTGANTGTDFTHLRYGALRLALIDVATGAVRVLPAMPAARHINPSYSADGRSLYFVSDAGGFSEIYRMVVETCQLFQVTRTATGVSGVTATSPALSVARESGRLVFSIFDNAGFHLAGLAPERAQGEPLLETATDSTRASAAILPSDAGVSSAVSEYLSDADTGLPDADAGTTAQPYHTAFRLAGIGQPSIGVGGGGVFGTQVMGGASVYFTDMLGNNSLGVAVQASGQLRDIGGQLTYLNTGRRWNWGASVERIPYVLAYASVSGSGAATSVDYTLAHIAVSGASLITQYPLSATRRFELGGGYTHYSYSLEAIQQQFVGNAQVSNERTQLDAPSSLGMAEASAAYVGDDAVFAFTSPISGTRYRLSVSPTIGSLSYETVLADYRKYFFFKPLTLAVRGMHYGRYGKDGDSDRLGSLFLGDGSLVRGYSYDSFSSAECSAPNASGSLANSSCPQFDRLLGSRLALANIELRIPVFGTQGFGLIHSVLPPMELSGFVDAGVAWTGSSAPVWQLASNSADRTPVASAGIATRWNLFGAAILQVYYAHPFQRGNRGGMFGFLLQPGW